MRKLLLFLCLSNFISCDPVMAQCYAPKTAQVRQAQTEVGTIVEFRIKNDSPTESYHVVITGGSLSKPVNADTWLSSDQADGLAPKNFVITRVTGFKAGSYIYTIQAFCDSTHKLSSDYLEGKFVIK